MQRWGPTAAIGLGTIVVIGVLENDGWLTYVMATLLVGALWMALAATSSVAGQVPTGLFAVACALAVMIGFFLATFVNVFGMWPAGFVLAAVVARITAGVWAEETS